MSLFFILLNASITLLIKYFIHQIKSSFAAHNLFKNGRRETTNIANPIFNCHRNIILTSANIPEYQTTLSAASAEKKAYLEYLVALRDAGVDVESDLRKLYESSRNMLTDV